MMLAGVATAAADDSNLMTGWVHKSNKTGKRWKKRFIVCNRSAATLAWFASDPAFSLARYHVKEDPLGQIIVRGASLFTCEGVKGTPQPNVLKIVTPERTQLLAFPTKEPMDKWRAFVARAADPLASTGVVGGGADVGAGRMLVGGGGAGAIAAAGGDAAAAVALPADPEDCCGWLLKAAPGWRTFQERYCVLDAEELSLRYYDSGPTAAQAIAALGGTLPRGVDASRLPPLAGETASTLMKDLAKDRAPKGTVVLRGATVSTKAWSDSADAAGMLASSPTFCVTAENGRLYAFVASSGVEMTVWTARIGQAIAEADRIFSQGIFGSGGGGGKGLGGGAGGAADDAAQISAAQARRVSMVVPFKKAAKALSASARSLGAPLHVTFLSAKDERASGYMHK